MKHTLKALLTTTLLTVPSVFGSAQPAKSTAAAQNATSPGGPAKGDEAPAGQPPRLPITQLSEPADQSATSPGAAALAIEADSARPIAFVWPELFGVGPNTSFKSILDSAFEKKIWTRSATKAELAALETAINGNKNFEDIHKDILKGLLPNATLQNTQDAADRLGWLGFNYYNNAAKLYTRLANHENATAWNIRHAADGFKFLGDQLASKELFTESAKYHDSAAELYIRSTTTKSAMQDDIHSAEYRLNDIGFRYPEDSAERTKYLGMGQKMRDKYIIWD